MTSWFNVIFNGEEELKKYTEEQANGYKDNYEEILKIDPLMDVKKSTDEVKEEVVENFEADGGIFKGKTVNVLENQNSNASGLDYVKEKAFKAIEKHSMNIRGLERNRLMTRAYLLLGKARYLNGETFPAMEAFNQVKYYTPRTKKSPQADIYLALCEIQGENYSRAEDQLIKMIGTKEINKKYKHQAEKHLTQVYINQKEYDQATIRLQNAIESSKNKREKARLWFILGQLYKKQGYMKPAEGAFTNSLKKKPTNEMRVKTWLELAAITPVNRERFQKVEKGLSKIAKQGIYKKYRNEAYYGLGTLHLNGRDTLGAEKYFEKALREEVSDPMVRAKTHLYMAEINLRKEEYLKANRYYDSAALSSNDEYFKRFINRKSSKVKELARLFYTIEKNDSILKLTKMSDGERKVYFENFIEKLKRQEKEKQAQEAVQYAQFQTQTQDAGFTFGGETNKKFYFYNESLKSFGKNEFKRIWGDRPLTDNWRTQSNQIGGDEVNINDEKNELLGLVDATNPRRYEVDYYTELIPSDSEEIERLTIERDTAQFNLGLMYFDTFENKKKATQSLEKLLKRPPYNELLEQKTLFHLNRIDEGNTIYVNQLEQKYPESIYTLKAKNPTVENLNPNSEDALTFYEETFNLYKNNNFTETLSRIEMAENQFAKEPILAKFKLLKAYTLKKTGGNEAFQKALQEVIENHPDAEEALKAQELLTQLKK